MEMLIYFKSLGRYLCESPAHIREELVKELRERMHQKDRCLSLLTNSDAVQNDLDDNSKRLAKLIVRDPNAPASVLSRLSYTSDKEVLERIAEHPRASVYTLTELARSEHAEVRMAVAENANTPEHLVAILAQDDHPDVRYRIAENHNICVTILVLLEDDENPYVSLRASQTLERLNFGYKTAIAAA